MNNINQNNYSYFFAPPPFKISWPFVVIAIVTHSVSYHSFRAIVLVHLHYKFNQTIDELKIVTWVFDTLYYVFLGIGAVIQELQTDKYSGVLLLLFMINVCYLFFYMSSYLILPQIAYMAVAAMSGALRVGLIAYGANEFNGRNCTKALTYFSFTYIVEIFGHFIALRLVPLDMMIKKACGRLTCTSYVMAITIVFEIMAWIAFSCVNANIVKSVEPICAKLPKMGRNLVAFLPFLIVWLYFGDGVWRWILQARLMNCNLLWYNFSASDMLSVDLIALVLCGFIFLLFTLSNCVVDTPAIITGVGGICMSIGLLLSFHVYGTLQDSDNDNVPTNVSRLYISAYSHDPQKPNLRINMNSTSLYYPELKSFHTDWNLGGHEACYVIKVSSIIPNVKAENSADTFKMCLKEHKSYMLHVKCLKFSETFYYKVSHFPFNTTRDIYGRPKVCIVCTGSIYTNNYQIRLHDIHHPESSFTAMSNDNFTCGTLTEGRYSLLVDNSKPDDWQNIRFSYGGVYLLHINVKATLENIEEIRKPLSTTVWYLLPSILLVAFGRNCVIVTGMYIVHSQSPASVRVIALGFWWLYISSGIFVFTISDRIDGHYTQTRLSFDQTSILIFIMTMIFLCLAFCFTTEWNFNCDDELNDEDENGRRRSSAMNRSQSQMGEKSKSWIQRLSSLIRSKSRKSEQSETGAQQESDIQPGTSASSQIAAQGTPIIYHNDVLEVHYKYRK